MSTHLFRCPTVFIGLFLVGTVGVDWAKRAYGAGPAGAEGAAYAPFHAEATIDMGPDRGQHFGSLFEVVDAQGRVVAGAGFQGAYNTYVRSERTQLQFFIRSRQRPAAWSVERLPDIETEGTGFYPWLLGGELYVANRGGGDPRVRRWNAAQRVWDVVSEVHPTAHFVGGKLLTRQGERLVYDGVPVVDATVTNERLGEYYFALGNLYVRQFADEGETRTNRVVVYPWRPEESPTRLLTAQPEWNRPLSAPREFFYAFAQWHDHVIGVTNAGTVLRFADQAWQTLRESVPTVSYQVYCSVNVYDKLLLGQFPHGGMFEYSGGDVTPLANAPPAMPGVATTARELQSASIYGGDVFAGVWPWAELWRYDVDEAQWSFVQRMFNHPELTDKVQHPYETETKQFDKIANLWGQRITGLVALHDSLVIATSSKGGQAWEPRFAFLSPQARRDYGAIYLAKRPGNLAVAAKWKPAPTTFGFTLADGRMTIHQDGQELGSLAVDADVQDFLQSAEPQPLRIRWGEGVFGKCAARFVKRHSTLSLATLPVTLRAAYLHPELVLGDVVDGATGRAQAKQTLDQAVSIGLNALFPYFTGSSGQAYYPSDVAHRSEQSSVDPLRYLVSEAKARGVKVYPVVCVAVCGNEHPAGALLEHPEWGLRHPDGSPLGYLSPAHPEARRWIVRIIEEILERYEPDGVVLDYIRFHNRPLRLDVAAEERFESALPPGCSPEERQRRLQAFKESELTTWVSEIAQGVRSQRPGAALGIYCWGPHTIKDHLTAQIWPTWVERGDVDFVNVSGYYHRDKYGERYLPLFEQRMSESMALNGALARPAQLSFALGLNTSHGRCHSIEDVREYLHSAQKIGLPGYAYFAWHDLGPYLGELANDARAVVHTSVDVAPSSGLALHFPFAGSAQNIVSGASAIVHGVVDLAAPGPSARIVGAGNWIEASPADAPRLGKGDFSVALWMQSDEASAHASGDLVSQYETTSRRGFHLTLKSNLGVASNQANWRQLQFGVDNNQAAPWQECGRPGNALFAFAMASHAGELYAGTCEPDAGQSGRVYRYGGSDQWIDCGAPDGSNSVTSLAVYAGDLYAGTGKYRLAGSALPESANATLGGRVFRYGGDDRWIDCGRLPNTEAVGGMVVYRGQLYASSLYKPAGFFRYDPQAAGDARWVDCGTPGGQRVEALTVHDGFLYASSYDGGHVYRYDGAQWTDCGQLGENSQTYSFVSYEGELLVGTWPSGRVYRLNDKGRLKNNVPFDGTDAWSDLGRLGDELEVMGMTVHNGQLIAGTLPLAEVHRYEGNSQWRRLERLDHTPDVKYRRAWTMAEHGGRLYCSTLPSGKVFSYAAGCQTAYEQSLSSAWHHVAAVKSADRLALFVDGKRVAESREFSRDAYDLDVAAPLRIGMGANGPFNGRLADVRLYRRILDAAEIEGLASTPPDR